MKYLSIFIIILSLSACSNSNIEQKNLVVDSSKTKAVPDSSITAISPEQTVINFLKWYKYNNERIYQIHIIKGGGLDTTTFYRVDFAQAEKFIGEFKKSGFLSATYIDNLKNYFKKADEDLKANPQNDDVPVAFSSDIIMHTQEDLSAARSVEWDNILKGRTSVEMLSANEAIVHLHGYYKLRCKLSLVNNTWLIDNTLSDNK